jgi:DNA modification methylase
MSYLVLNGKVLDPFCGSGTTGIACKLEGFEFVGIEQDAEYCKIAEARITNFTEEPEEVLKSNTDDEVSQNEGENPRFGGQMELFS